MGIKIKDACLLAHQMQVVWVMTRIGIYTQQLGVIIMQSKTKPWKLSHIAQYKAGYRMGSYDAINFTYLRLPPKYTFSGDLCPIYLGYVDGALRVNPANLLKIL